MRKVFKSILFLMVCSFFAFSTNLQADPPNMANQDCIKVDWQSLESDAVNKYPYDIDAIACKSRKQWNAFWKKVKADPPQVQIDFQRDTALLFPRLEWTRNKIVMVCQRHADIMVYWIQRTGPGMALPNQPAPPPAVDIYMIPKSALPVHFMAKVITLN